MTADGTQNTCVLALLQRMRWATLLQRLGEKSTPAPKTVCAPCRNEGLDIIARDKNALKRMQTQLLQIIIKQTELLSFSQIANPHCVWQAASLRHGKGLAVAGEPGTRDNTNRYHMGRL